MTTFSELVCAVATMRAAQKQYFKTKDKKDLYHAWNMERAVDQMLEDAFKPIDAGAPGSAMETPPRSEERNDQTLEPRQGEEPF